MAWSGEPPRRPPSSSSCEGGGGIVAMPCRSGLPLPLAPRYARPGCARPLCAPASGKDKSKGPGHQVVAPTDPCRAGLRRAASRRTDEWYYFEGTMIRSRKWLVTLDPSSIRRTGPNPKPHPAWDAADKRGPARLPTKKTSAMGPHEPKVIPSPSSSQHDGQRPSDCVLRGARMHPFTELSLGGFFGAGQSRFRAACAGRSTRRHAGLKVFSLFLRRFFTGSSFDA
jgi:hypothetical protein